MGQRTEFGALQSGKQADIIGECRRQVVNIYFCSHILIACYLEAPFEHRLRCTSVPVKHHLHSRPCNKEMARGWFRIVKPPRDEGLGEALPKTIPLSSLNSLACDLSLALSLSIPILIPDSRYRNLSHSQTSPLFSKIYKQNMSSHDPILSPNEIFPLVSGLLSMLLLLCSYGYPA
jgi:hypothetical protein